jgi:putative intracellular protease/amidase
MKILMALKELSQTVKLCGMKSKDFDTIFCSGGHGPMWDLVDNPDASALYEAFCNSGKPVAAKALIELFAARKAA